MKIGSMVTVQVAEGGFIVSRRGPAGGHHPTIVVLEEHQYRAVTLGNAILKVLTAMSGDPLVGEPETAEKLEGRARGRNATMEETSADRVWWLSETAGAASGWPSNTGRDRGREAQEAEKNRVLDEHVAQVRADVSGEEGPLGEPADVRAAREVLAGMGKPGRE